MGKTWALLKSWVNQTRRAGLSSRVFKGLFKGHTINRTRHTKLQPQTCKEQAIGRGKLGHFFKAQVFPPNRTSDQVLPRPVLGRLGHPSLPPYMSATDEAPRATVRGSRIRASGRETNPKRGMLTFLPISRWFRLFPPPSAPLDVPWVPRVRRIFGS